MQVENLFTAIDCHTAGEQARIITTGFSIIRGRTMAEKSRYFAKNLDHIRTALMQEPRGHEGMFGAVLMPPTSEEAHWGVLSLWTPPATSICAVMRSAPSVPWPSRQA